MIALVRIFIFLFVLFLSTPTIVSLIEKDAEVSSFYSMSEEEHSHKEVKAEPPMHSSSLVLSSGVDPQKINIEGLIKHDNICAAIFIPPPELI